jgi:ethanolamine ammonia-lyase small subunit
MIEIAKEVVPGADIDFRRKRVRQKENKHVTFASSRNYKQALMAGHENEAPIDVREYLAQPEFIALAARLIGRDFKEEEIDYLSYFFFENSPMTGHRVEVLIGQALSAKGNKLHLRSYCEHLKEGLRQQRRQS